MNYMLKMLKWGLCLSMLGIFLGYAAQERARADSPPPVDNLGRFLGLTVQCSCVSADEDQALHVYRAHLAETYGSTYANQAWGHMKLALHEAGDNQSIICGQVCDRDSIASLQELLDMGSGLYGEVEQTTDKNDNIALDSSSVFSLCRTQITRPECRRNELQEIE